MPTDVANPTVATRPVLRRDPDFLALFTGAAVSEFGTQVSYLAIPLVAITALGAGAAEVGVLGVLTTVAFILVGLPAGAWVDRMRRRGVMIATDLARAALVLSVPVAWWLDALTLYQLYGVALFTGVGTVFFDVAAQSYLPNLVGRGQLAEANAALVSMRSVNNIAGRGVGGYLVSALTAPVALLVDAVSYLCSAVCVGVIGRPEPVPEPAARAGLGRDIGEGVRYVAGHPMLRAFAAYGSLVNLSTTLIVTMVPVLFVTDLGFSGGTLGLFLAAGGVGNLIGALAARRLAAVLGHGRTLWMAGVAAAPFGFLVPLVDRGGWLWVATCAWVAAGLVSGVGNVLQVSLRQRITPDRLLGRMNATMRFVLTGAVAVGAALSGLLGGVLGARAALWAGVAVLAVAWLPLVFSPLRTLRDLPPPA